jgi:hypothetical protein
MKIEDVKDLVLDKIPAREEDVDPKELAMGIEVEYEHTSNREVAKRIALVHLKEFPDYYTRLKKMEKEGEKAKENESKNR